MNMRIVLAVTILLLMAVPAGVSASDLSLSGPSSIIAGNHFTLSISGGDSFGVVTLSMTSGRSDMTLLPGQSDVSGSASSATVKLDAFGKATIEYYTNTGGDEMSCRFRVSDDSSHDTATVKVTRGSMSATVAPTQKPLQSSYAVGSTVPLSGSAPGKSYVYLFLTGPNLAAGGVKLDSPSTAAVTDDASTFVRRGVDSSGRWSYNWQTRGSLDTGTYTIYAVDKPANRYSLSGTSYATYSVTLGRGSVTASASNNPSKTASTPVETTVTEVPTEIPEPVETEEPIEEKKSFWDMFDGWFNWLIGK